MDHINNEAKAFQREGLTCADAQLIQGHARLCMDQESDFSQKLRDLGEKCTKDKIIKGILPMLVCPQTMSDGNRN